MIANSKVFKALFWFAKSRYHSFNTSLDSFMALEFTCRDRVCEDYHGICLDFRARIFEFFPKNATGHDHKTGKSQGHAMYLS